MYSQAAQAYQKTSQATVNPRELEASLLMKSAAQLQAIIDNWYEDHPELDAAVIYNRRLWTVLVSSATAEDNPLPVEIKQNVANIGIFIFKRSLSLLARPEKDQIDALVNINVNIAEGLRDSPGGGAEGENSAEISPDTNSAAATSA